MTGRTRGRRDRASTSGPSAGAPWLRSRAKRCIDAGAAAAALVVLSPLLTITAAAVRIRLGSPVLFRQERAGLDGEPFDVVKFRSMSEPADADGTALSDRDRLTPFGRALRSSSLDELPQLWSVLRGDMSIVGPRPLPMKYVARYSDAQRRRLLAVPGITGWAQIHGRNDIDWPTKLAHDAHYVDHASFLLDVRIVIGTIRAVIARDGVSATGHATMPEFTGIEGLPGEGRGGSL